MRSHVLGFDSSGCSCTSCLWLYVDMFTLRLSLGIGLLWNAWYLHKFFLKKHWVILQDPNAHSAQLNMTIFDVAAGLGLMNPNEITFVHMVAIQCLAQQGPSALHSITPNIGFQKLRELKDLFKVNRKRSGSQFAGELILYPQTPEELQAQAPDLFNHAYPYAHTGDPEHVPCQCPLDENVLFHLRVKLPARVTHQAVQAVAGPCRKRPMLALPGMFPAQQMPAGSLNHMIANDFLQQQQALQQQQQQQQYVMRNDLDINLPGFRLCAPSVPPVPATWQGQATGSAGNGAIAGLVCAQPASVPASLPIPLPNGQPVPDSTTPAETATNGNECTIHVTKKTISNDSSVRSCEELQSRIFKVGESMCLYAVTYSPTPALY